MTSTGSSNVANFRLNVDGTYTLRPGGNPSITLPQAIAFDASGNLYAADGALFPTSSGFNPTMTIVALSTYVAGGMAYPGSPERALS